MDRDEDGEKLVVDWEDCDVLPGFGGEGTWEESTGESETLPKSEGEDDGEGMSREDGGDERRVASRDERCRARTGVFSSSVLPFLDVFRPDDICTKKPKST